MKKRLLSLALALSLVLGFLPAASVTAKADAGIGGETHTSHPICGASCTDGEHSSETWIGVSSLSDINEGGYYYLNTDVEISTTWHPPTGDISLCLNGHSITYKNNTSGNHGSVIEVDVGVTFTLTDCSTKTSYGYWSDKTYNIVEKRENVPNGTTPDELIGGLITGGTGTLRGSSTYDDLYGGGVYVNGVGSSDQKATFNMYGGNIAANKVTDRLGMGGGVCVNATNNSNTGGATFNMYGGTITGNRANAGESELASHWSGGGGVCVRSSQRATFHMYGGAISNNNAQYGGGILVIGQKNDNSAVDIQGGTITGNTSDNSGGGVKVWGGTLNLVSGSIINNTAVNGNGGGVIMEALDNSSAAFSVSGSPTITGNTQGESKTTSNVYLTSSQKITVTGALTGGSIGVTMASTTGTFTTKWGQYNATNSAFFSDDGLYSVKTTGTGTGAELVLAVHESHKVCNESGCEDGHSDITWTAWDSTSSLPEAKDVQTTPYYYLTKDVTIDETWQPADGTYLCLNGHTITYKGESGSVIKVTGAFTLTDCAATAGKITGGKGFNLQGGGIYIDGGTFFMYGGSIADNSVTGRNGAGGGVYMSSGTFYLYNGSIAGNSAEFGGGGVVVGGGQFTMSGGEITSNTVTGTSGCGGGVYVGFGSFTMTGGSITGNKSQSPGGGVYFGGNGANFYVSGSPVIKDNTYQGTTQNVTFSANTCVQVIGALSNGADIGVTVDNSNNIHFNIATGSGDHTVTSDDMAYFTSDRTGGVLFLDTSDIATIKQHWFYSEVCAVSDCNAHRHDVGGEAVVFEAWSESTSLPKTAGNYVLTTDVTLTDNYWMPKNGTVLDLNGHSISYDKQYNDSNVINVTSGVNFTLYDCNGSRGIHYGQWNKSKTAYEISKTTKDLDASRSYDTLVGGLITNGTGNMGTSGGGVYIHEGGIFTMYGGVIAGNKIAEGGCGGGVYVEGTFNLYGGTITGNTGVKGGVYIDSAAKAFSVKDSPKVTGNASSGVYLSTGKEINVVGALTGASIGVTMEQPGTFTSSWSTANSETATSVFTSDDSTYVVIKNTELALHQHSLQYALDSASVIKETCSSCDHKGTATINAPTSTTYTGSEINATVRYNNWVGLQNLTITYDPTNHTSVNSSITASISQYKDGISGETVTASVTFAITAATQETPAADVVTIDYKAETITFNSAYEVNTQSDFNGTSIANGDSISSYIGSEATTIYVRTKADGNHSTSEAVAVPIAARPAAPTAEAVDETILDKTDGKLTGVDNTMEYKLSTADTWTAITGTEVTGLAPGTYNVRKQATATAFYGETATVIVAAGPGLTVTFNSNGGSDVGRRTGLSYNATVTAPDSPTRSGYRFAGWYSDSALTTAWNFRTNTVTADTTLYAAWELRVISTGSSTTNSTTTTTESTGTGLAITTTTDNGVKDSVALTDDVVENGETVTLPVSLTAGESLEIDTPETVSVEIPVENVSATTVVVIVNEDGTEEIVKTAKLTEDGLSLTVSGNATVKIVDNSKQFEDVNDGYWGETAIYFSAARELFNGTTVTTFSPEADTTRQMLVTVLARLDGEDTTSGNAYDIGMAWAVANNISDGSNPTDTITREQLATMLWRYVGSPDSSLETLDFTDADEVSAYAETAMRWAVETGILTGKGNGILDPQGSATRAQVAQMLMKFINQN